MEAAINTHPYSRGEEVDSTFWWKNLQGFERVCRPANIAVAFFGKYNLPQLITWGEHKSSSCDQETMSEQHERGQGNSRRMKGLSANPFAPPCPPAIQEGKDSGSRSFGDGTWAKGHTILVKGIIPLPAGGAWKMWITHQWPSMRTWGMLIKAMDTQNREGCQELSRSGSWLQLPKSLRTQFWEKRTTSCFLNQIAQEKSLKVSCIF